ncbi:MAG TPA: hypothetical protein VFU76_03730 [Terriglobales bacterium]|nr:hypothetical protein [Terriglobales bacterium]
MLRRFAAAAATCAVLISVAALIVFTVRPVPLERASLVLLLWCLAPAVWGMWAMVAPTRWIALPLWGALLGLILSGTAMLVLNLPQRVFGLPVSLFVRLLGVLLIAAFYYVAWSIVGVVQETLQTRAVAGPKDVSEHVLAAHDLLLSARGAAHPQVDEAIRRLELALANLTLRTSGML